MAVESLFDCLEQVKDPRKARAVRHPFQAILRVTLLVPQSQIKFVGLVSSPVERWRQSLCLVSEANFTTAVMVEVAT